jgi:transposase
MKFQNALHNMQSIADMGFFEFRRQLDYKCVLYGSKLILADRFFPSSKLCSNCGTKKESLSLKERIYQCDNCYEVIDRDLNASYNLARTAKDSEETSEIASSQIGRATTEFTPGGEGAADSLH